MNPLVLNKSLAIGLMSTVEISLKTLILVAPPTF